MPAALRPQTVSRCRLDGGRLEIPPGGLSFRDCAFHNMPWAHALFPAFIACGCIFDACDFSSAHLRAGYFGGGEKAGFRQTLYRGCIFDGAALNGMSFGSARFERCSFRNVRLRQWLAFRAEFVDCVFAGPIPEAAFLGRSPLLAAARERNEFRGNDFSQADFGAVEFRGGVDLTLQRLPAGNGGLLLDRRAERIARALAQIESWPDATDRRAASRYLQRYNTARYEEQEQLYLLDRPSPLIAGSLRARVFEILANCLPSAPRS